ncbi:hypothetical protein [uncultured Dialister sp.]|uniref:hypothetical protein n=1 Tax=uncultured Dialister sp. TaxID=278064 RepID=UPI0034CE9436
MKQQEEEYNYSWKVIEAAFHRRAYELFDFQFRRRLEFGTDVADEYKYTSTNKNHKKRNDEKVDFDCPDRGRDSADRIVAYQ